MKKLLRSALTLVMVLTMMNLIAFAAEPADDPTCASFPNDVESIVTESSYDDELLPEPVMDVGFADCIGNWPADTPVEEPFYTEAPEFPTGIIGMPTSDGSHRTRSWLADQIRLTPRFANVYSDGEICAYMGLSDATKIIFIVHQLYPTEYAFEYGDEVLEYGFMIPCGINRQYYNYLVAVEDMSWRCSDGVDGLMANYDADELADMYADLKAAAQPYQSELIDWLDDFSVELRLPGFVMNSTH